MAINPETAPSLEEELNESEILPFKKQEREIIEKLTEKYTETAEISEESKKVLDGFLAKDAEEGYRMFALAYFEENKDLIQREKGLPIENTSDDWKINMVLNSRERGGMGAAKEIKEGNYKKIGDEIDKIGILRTDMAKKHIPPETPFLLLNYLQRSVEGEKKKIETLKAKAEKGDEAAGLKAVSKEKQLEELYLARKELVEKTMHEGLNQRAEDELKKSGFPSKENYIVKEIDAKTELLKGGSNELLMAQQWVEFQKLTEKQKRKFQLDLGHGPAEKGLSPRWIANKDELTMSMLAAAKDNDIEGDAFYGLLQQGYKPYETQVKGFFTVWPLSKILPMTIEISKTSGKPEKIPISEFNNFVKNAAEKYKNSITEDAQKRLANEWSEVHDEKVKIGMEKRIEELASSPDLAEGGIEAVYQKARDRIIAESFKNKVEKNPKTAEQLKTLQQELNEGGKDKNINDFMEDVLSRKGELEKLVPDNKKWRGVISQYLQKECGMNWDRIGNGIINGISQEKYEEALNKKTGLFYLMMNIMKNMLEVPATKKKTRRKAA